MKKLFAALGVLLLCCGCRPGQGTVTPLSRPSATAAITLAPLPSTGLTPPPRPSATSSFTPRPFPTPTSSPTLTTVPTATLDPYLGYTIDSLRARSYGSGNLEIVETLGEFDSFSRYVVVYPSDGLDIYAILSLPAGKGPFPVILLLHGYDWPLNYNLYTDVLDTDDGLVGEGYLVLHPAMRNYAPSDSGDNLFRVGLAIDVLNLIALVQSQGGQEGPLAQADPERIGLWGYSMGGGVALRVLTVTSDVDAAVLYAPISGDESKNRVLFAELADGYDLQFSGEADVPEDELALISPSHFYSFITSPVQIFHGTADTVVPVEWTVETCELIGKAGKAPDCIFYEGGGHSFLARYLEDMVPRMYEFYRRYLSP